MITYMHAGRLTSEVQITADNVFSSSLLFLFYMAQLYACKPIELTNQIWCIKFYSALKDKKIELSHVKFRQK